VKGKWAEGQVICLMLKKEDAEALNQQKFIRRIVRLVEIVSLDEIYEKKEPKD
jgi:hypothetical protein